MRKLNNIILIIFNKINLFGFLLIILNFQVIAQQYNIAGTAVTMSTSGCYRLTNTTSQAGAVWNVYKINLTQPFDITLTLNFGNRNVTTYVPATCGADGMSFVLQPLSSGVFGAGSGVGFHGITPSVGIVMDTYTDNPTDPSYQHISIHKNGDELHGTTNELKSYTSAIGFPTNITDGLDHKFRFTWTPNSTGIGTINVYFGTATTLPTTPTQTYTGNIVANIFSGDPNVYWGVSASTGGCWNIQTVCMTTVSNFTSDTSTCVGTPVTFTNNSISGLPVTTYVWDFGDGNYDYIASPTHTYSTAGTFNVSLGIFTQGGFYSTITHPIIVHPKPNVVVNNPSICKGDTATLNVTGATSYSWNNGLGTGTIKKVSPQSTNSYIVTGTNTWGCINKDTSLVTVNPNPVITANSDTICAGDTATLLASGGNTYLWTPTGSTSNPLLISPSTSTQYKVVGTNNFGCKDSTSANVVFYQNPILSVNSDTICLNETAVLTANGAISYVWGNNFSTANPLNISPNITTTYIVTGTDANNCKGKDSAKVVVNIPPQISVDSAEICFGYPAKLTVSGGNNLNYLWQNISSTANPLIISPSSSATYTVIATDINGCKDTASGFINVHPKPVAAFYANPTTVNTDSPIVSFTNNSTNATSWLWNFGDINSTDNISTLPSPNHSYSSAGTFIFWLHAFSDFGCQDSIYGKIYVETPISFYIPNAFIPSSTNPDVNIFKPKGTGIDPQKYLMIIYNRWGQEIFQTTDWQGGWNGKYNNAGELVEPGVYVYYISYKELYGVFKERSGSVTLVR